MLTLGLSALSAASFPSASFQEGTAVNTGFQSSLTATDISRLQAAGIKYLRIDLKWRDLETPKNTYNWSAYHDALVQQLNNAGLKPIFLLSYGNNHYGSNGITMDEADEIQGFANFAVAAVNRYDAPGVIWEIWNEQNTENFWAVGDPINTPTNARQRAANYMGLINAVSPAMKAAKPNCTIISGGVLDIGWNVTTAWFDECFSLGLLTKVDGLGMHPYGGATSNKYIERMVTQMANLRALIVSYGGSPDFPILNTEYGAGYDEYSGTMAQQLDEQAAVYARTCLLSRMVGLKMHTWYNWRHFQVPHSMIDGSGNPRPAHTASCILFNQFQNYTFERSEKLGAPGDYALVFQNGGNRKVAVWTTGTPRTAAIPVTGGTSFSVVSLFGTSSNVTVSNGHIQVPISGQPVYINLGTGNLGTMASGGLLTQDIGTVTDGFSGAAAGSYWLQARSGDIWGTSDSFRFIYTELTGNGSITARVTGLTNTSATAKAGVMMREKLLAGARHVSLVATPGGQPQFLRRTVETTGSTTATSGGTGTYMMPHWVRMTRSGNEFISYRSLDNGASWTEFARVTVAMQPTIYIGLAVASNKTDQTAIGTFDNVTPDLTQATGGNGALFNAFDRIEAESRTSTQGTANYTGGSGQKVGSIENNTWISFSSVDFENGAGSVSARLASNAAGGTVEFRLGSTTGTLIGSVSVGGTGGWNNFVDVSGPISGVSGVQTLYLVFKGSGSSSLLDIDYFQFAEPENTFLVAQIGGAPAGAAVEDNGTFTVDGNGLGIENGSDQFQYVYTTLTGNGVLTAKVHSLEYTHKWAKAGLMFRESLNANSRHFTSLVNADGVVRFSRRTETGGNITAVGNAYGLRWLRIERTGNIFRSWESSNGTTWNSLGSYEWPGAPATMYLGLTASSYISGNAATIVFQNVTFPQD